MFHVSFRTYGVWLELTQDKHEFNEEIPYLRMDNSFFIWCDQGHIYSSALLILHRIDQIFFCQPEFYSG